MTPEEALRDIISDGINLGAGDYVDVEALKVACVALEKQIPKKIKVHSEKACCPACSALFVWGKQPYCEHCGQALDWSDFKWPHVKN